MKMAENLTRETGLEQLKILPGFLAGSLSSFLKDTQHGKNGFNPMNVM